MKRCNTGGLPERREMGINDRIYLNPKVDPGQVEI